jgi:FixJ family two-component response regulator
MSGVATPGTSRYPTVEQERQFTLATSCQSAASEHGTLVSRLGALDPRERSGFEEVVEGVVS